MLINSYAKINLFLNIKNKLKNGYHSLETVMQSIELHDEVLLEHLDHDEIIIECNDESIPTDERNTCFKAAAAIKNKYNINWGIYIKLNKFIPSEAGLAGGSSNSAAVIKGLNYLWNLKLDNNKLLELGLQVGADVPFCLMGGTFLAEGIGEKLTKLNDFKWDNILIVKPPFSMSTAVVYNNLSPENYNLYSKNEILNNIRNNNFYDASLCTANTLERVVENMYPEINHIKNTILESGAVTSMMTGSGSAIYGLFNDESSLDTAYSKLIKNYSKIYKTKTYNKGIEFIY